MTKMNKDLKIEDIKFLNAAEDMKKLKTRTEKLKRKLDDMYEELTNALDSETGDEIKKISKNTLLEPIENMALVVGHVSNTLDMIIGGGYYKDVFDGFDEIKRHF